MFAWREHCSWLPATRFTGRLGLLPRPRVDLQDAGVRRVLKLMAPAIFGTSVSQLNLLINTLIASLLTSGSISWLYYSDRLVEFPLGIFGVGLEHGDSSAPLPPPGTP